jgi:hypothetical protein
MTLGWLMGLAGIVNAVYLDDAARYGTLKQVLILPGYIVTIPAPARLNPTQLTYFP